MIIVDVGHETERDGEEQVNSVKAVLRTRTRKMARKINREPCSTQQEG